MLPLPVSAYPYLIKSAKEAGDEETLDILHQNRWDSGIHDQEDTNLHMLRIARRKSLWALTLKILEYSPQGIARDECLDYFETLGFSPEELEVAIAKGSDPFKRLDRYCPNIASRKFFWRMALKGRKVSSYSHDQTFVVSFKGFHMKCKMNQGRGCLEVSFLHDSGTIDDVWSFHLLLLEKDGLLEMAKSKSYQLFNIKKAEPGSDLSQLCSWITEAANKVSELKYSEDVVSKYLLDYNIVWRREALAYLESDRKNRVNTIKPDNPMPKKGGLSS